MRGSQLGVYSPRASGVSEDRRAVSELLGTVLVISLAFLSALLLVGVGTVVLDEMQAESSDSLSQDAMLEMNDRLTEVSASSVDAPTSFQFPSGSNVDAAPMRGTVNITVRTIDAFWDDDEADRPVLANQQVNYSEMTMGTIVHESEDGVITASQGGGVWQLQDGAVEMLAPPAIDYRGTSLDLSFTRLSGTDSISAGQEITAMHNVTATEAVSGKIDRILGYQQEIPGTHLDAGVYVNVTITSKFAAGWKYHAEEVMQREPTAIYGPGDPDHDLGDQQVKLVFGPFGETLADVDTDVDFPGSVCYAGLSQYATVTESDNCDLQPHEEGIVVGDDNHEFGLYYKDRWVTYDTDIDQWETVFEGEPVDEPEMVRDVGRLAPPGNDYYYHLEPNSVVCIVQGAPLQGQLNAGKCTEEMVGINDTSPFEPEYTDYEVLDVSANRDLVPLGETVNVTVTVENTGTTAGPSTPLGVFFEGTLVAGTEAISPGPGETYTDTFELKPDGVGEGSFVAATTDDNASSDEVEIRMPAEVSNFAVEDVTVPQDEISTGEDLTVETTVHNYGEAIDTQYLQLIFDDGEEERFLAAEEITLEPDGGDDTTSHTFRWSTTAADATTDGTVVVRTDDDERERPGVEIDGSTDDGHFQVVITDVDDRVTEGERLTVTADVINKGAATDSQEVTLRNFEGHPVDVAEVSRLAPEQSTEVELTWETGYDIVGGDGPPFVRDTVAVRTDEHDDAAEVRIDEAGGEERDPFDVYLALDETGSMAFNFTDVAYWDWEWVYPTDTVPAGKTWAVHPAYNEEFDRTGGFLQAGESPSKMVEVHRGLPGQDPDGRRIDASLSLMNELDSDLDRVGAYQWDTHINHLETLTHNFRKVENSLATDAYNDTDITQAIDYGLQSFDAEVGDDAERQPVLVLLTDGMHTASAHDGPLDETFPEYEYSTVVEQADAESVTIHTVGLGPLVEDDTLSEIARRTGGIYVHVTDPSDLEDAFGEVADELDPAEETFAVESVDVPAEVKAGETATVDVDIANTGTDDGVQDVFLEVDDAIVNRTSVFVPQGESATGVTLEWDTTGFATGLREITVVTEDDEETRYVDVLEADHARTNYEVGLADVPDTVRSDSHLEATLAVNNTGTADGEELVWLEVSIGGDWQRVALDSLRLEGAGGRNETTMTLRWEDLEAVVPGEYTIRAGSDDDVSRTVDVEVVSDEPALETEVLRVTDEDDETVGEEENVTEGEELTVQVGYHNRGAARADDALVELRVGGPDGDLVGVEHVDLAPRGRTTVNFTWNTAGYGSDAGPRQIVSITDADSHGRQVYVEPVGYEPNAAFDAQDSINVDLSEIEIDA